MLCSWALEMNTSISSVLAARPEALVRVDYAIPVPRRAVDVGGAAKAPTGSFVAERRGFCVVPYAEVLYVLPSDRRYYIQSNPLKQTPL